MRKALGSLHRQITTRTARQVGALYSSTLLGVGIGFATSIVNTRQMGPQGYGDMNFMMRVFLLWATLFPMGFFLTSGNLLAQKQHEGIRKELMGAMLLIGAVVSLVTLAANVAFAFCVEPVFGNGLGMLMLACSPFVFVFPMQLLLNEIMRGDNQIFRLSIFQITPQVLYLVGSILVGLCVVFTVQASWIVRFSCLCPIVLFEVWALKPSFRNLRPSLGLIWAENKRYGFQVFIGMLANVATAQLSGVLIGYYLNNAALGFVSLAVTVSGPLGMIPVTFANSLFRQFARADSIPRKATATTLVLSAAALGGFFLVVQPVIHLFYSEKFAAVIPLAMYSAFGAVLQGFGDFYNRFLGAHGRGREMRNSAFLVGFINVVGTIVLVQWFGILGAIWARVASSAVYCAAMYAGYWKVSRLLTVRTAEAGSVEGGGT